MHAFDTLNADREIIMLAVMDRPGTLFHAPSPATRDQEVVSMAMSARRMISAVKLVLRAAVTHAGAAMGRASTKS